MGEGLSRMRTTAIFVDAGYFFAASVELACGEPAPRNRVDCDYAGLVEGLTHWAKAQLKDEPVRLLRCYWYDGARDGIPTTQHLQVARLPDVKLRLGRKTSGGQKGVDGLIILDLITLAKEGGLDTAFLVSGDEDLREACLAAQQAGVRVVLVGVPPATQALNQAETLIREADEHHVLPEDFWTKHLTVMKHEAPPIFKGGGPVLDEQHPLRPVVREFIDSLREVLDPARVVTVVGCRPGLPKYVDAQLLKEAEAVCGEGLTDEIKRQLRATFWEQWDAATE